MADITTFQLEQSFILAGPFEFEIGGNVIAFGLPFDFENKYYRTQATVLHSPPKADGGFECSFHIMRTMMSYSDSALWFQKETLHGEAKDSKALEKSKRNAI